MMSFRCGLATALLCGGWNLAAASEPGAEPAAPVESRAGTTISGRIGSGGTRPTRGVWVEVTAKGAFSPRDTAEDALFAGKMWLSNGYYHGNVLTRDLWSSPDGLNWKLVNAKTPYDGYSELVVYDHKMWAVKGSVWNSTDGENWNRVSPRTPFGARGYGEVVVHQGRMWQVGGGAGVWHTADGINWICVAKQTSYGARTAAAVVAYGDKLWLLGGQVSKPNDPPEQGYQQMTTFNDVWCSDDGMHWKRVLEQAPWSPRMWFVAKVYAGRIWIIGGYDNVHANNLGDVWSTKDGIEWRQLVSDKSFSPRHEPTCYVFDDSLWVVAGNAWPVQNDVWRLTLLE